MNPVDHARSVLLDAIRSRVFPAASVDVGSSAGVLWHEPLGTLTFDRDAPPVVAATPFDLASLTKVIATTTVVMDLVASARVTLDEPIAVSFADWRGGDREPVTVRHLLEHASGLPARLFDPPPATRREFEHDICVMPLEYAPATRSIYSDLGFILLGLLLSRRGGHPLAVQFGGIAERFVEGEPALAREPLTFGLGGDRKAEAAPTIPLDEDARRGRTLAGDVHDNYAAVLGPFAGHAGLFGTSAGVAAFARIVLRAARGVTRGPSPMSSPLLATFLTRSAVPGSSRALGWDTMLPTSSCGARMSRAAFGHVGYTGTSLWIDPDRDRYFVLLTNRACQGGTLDEMRTVRRAFHDALGDI